MKAICRFVLFAGFVLSLASCDNPRPGAGEGLPDDVARQAAESINAEDLLGHIRTLASDAFEGRAPGTPGEEKTVAYLTEQFRQAGLQPGNPDGSYVQEVPLVGITTRPEAHFSAGGKAIPLAFPRDYVAVSYTLQPEVEVTNAEIVFVGYGVVAPEYGWDDYKDVDVRGKTILMLINDPAIPDPDDPSKLDTSVFKGRAMTYYGRWTYKYEIAAEKGAAAAIIIHETGPAGYPYEVVEGGWSHENFDAEQEGSAAARVPVEGWITRDKAQELLSATGHDLDALKQAALQKTFRPMPLGATATFHLRTEIRKIRSRNVVGKLEGSDPVLKDEYIVYTAHWDHLGRDTTLAGDQIYNGAMDNASGTAGLLELAKAFRRLPEAPARSILFLALTAEEQGLLGAKYYTANPLYPLERTLANINIDGLNASGRTKDVVVVGYGNTTLEDLLQEEAAKQGRVAAPDPEPENGGFYRADHFAFARRGVPALYTGGGDDYIGRPAGYGQELREAYTKNDYHKPSDEVRPDWDLSGGIEDLQLLFQVGYRIAEASEWPEWKPGAEFRAIREEMLQAGAR